MITRVLTRVFSHFQYLAVAGVVAFVVVSAAILLPNLQLIKQVLFATTVDLGVKISFMIGLYGSIATNFTIFSATSLVLVAMLFGINVALLLFYIRRRREIKVSKKTQLTSLGGIVSAVLGIGCAACGSVVLTAVFGTLGAGSIISFLPFDGFEFTVVGLGLLGLSTFYILKKINDPLICPID